MAKMSSSKAFGFVASGTMNEKVANVYNSQFNSYYESVGNSMSGWLGETLERVKEAHGVFMRSRLWEFGSKLKGRDGYYVGRYEIGFLGGLEFQQGAEGFMRDIIMANPIMMDLYERSMASGYDGELRGLCTGIGRDNFFYNKVNDGYLMKEEDGENYKHTVYYSTRDSMTHYSSKERSDAHRTWRASNIHVQKGFDPSNIEGGKLLTEKEAAEKIAKMELEKQKEIQDSQ